MNNHIIPFRSTTAVDDNDVKVVYGAHDFSVRLAGLTVAEIRLAFQDVLNLAECCEAYLDGAFVADKHATRVEPGARLEFMKGEGWKGGVPPFLRYCGGKSRLRIRDEILSKKPGRVQEYREPCVGGASLALRVDEYCGLVNVWINDIDPYLIALLTAVKERPDEFVQTCLALHPYEPGETESDERNRQIRELFERAVHDKAMDPALRYFVANRIGHNGRVNFAMPSRIGFRNPLGWKVTAIKRIIDAAPFVRPWKITCMDYAIPLLTPGDDVWCVLDPPYYKNTLLPPSSKQYAFNFTTDQHLRLAELVAMSEHNILLTYDDCEFVRNLYRPEDGFLVFPVEWPNVGTSLPEKDDAPQLIITNYTPLEVKSC